MKKLKRKIFNLLRNYLLKDITNKLGKIEEKEEKIICYVDNKKLKKYKSGRYIKKYELTLKSKNVYPKDILDAYKINKPIDYVINNMNFKEILTLIAGEDINVIFLNCKFNEKISVYTDGEVRFENNEYYNDDRWGLYFCEINCKKLKILNNNFINKSHYSREKNFGMKIDTTDLEIINSNFNIKKNEDVISIIANKVYIEDSDIKCHNEIYIKADELKVLGAKIKSETEVDIDNKNNDNYVIGVTSPKTIYNGVDLTKYYLLNSENLELQKVRISLVEKLRELRDNCIKINSIELKEVENTLNNRSVVKTMKK